jgi:hypothetical protein
MAKRGYINMSWDINTSAKPVSSSDQFWSALMDGGYVDLDDLLDNSEQIIKVRSAILALKDFKAALEDNDLIEEM